MGATFTPGTITWNWLGNQTMWACGCLEIPATPGPRALLRWCGQPDCLRLFQANVAYDDRQFAWQTAHGGTPVMVTALTRYMRTPLAQILPPPTGGQFFSGEIEMLPGGVMQAKTQEEPNDKQKEHEHDPKKGPHPPDKPPERGPQKQEPSQRR